MRRLVLGLNDGSEAWSLPDDMAEALARDFPDLQVVRARGDDELAAAAATAEILFSWFPGEEALERAEHLRWLHTPSAGVGPYLTPGVRERNTVVTNSRGVHAIPMAEHVMGMLISLARGFRRAVEAQAAPGGMKREAWWSGPGIPRELFGKTLGIYGYGAIGREAARRAIAFGMRVMALRRHPNRQEQWDPDLLRAVGLPAEEPRVDRVLGPDGFDRLLEESDAVLVTAPHTPETEGVFDARAFRRMKPGSWYVNVARGKINVEADLAAALRSGHLGGAALDVFERGLPPEDSELYGLPNLLMTPHVSSTSSGYWPRAMALFRANLERDAVGIPLLNRVNIERGY